MKRLLAALLPAAIALCLLSGCASQSAPRAQAPGRLLPVGEWAGASVVQTRYGQVRGSPDADLTWVWRAIPYAAPPVGDLRWRAPQDPAPWSGVWESPTFNGGCTQFALPRGPVVMGSEDCLYLNVWRPRSARTRLPVYVWIHGGGNGSGSSTAMAAYHGNRVAALSGMVFVSLNYRLGPFGWFTAPAFREEGSRLDASGNFGTLDIIKALRWIHDNISAFGGDPSRVTITGQSAGAADILSLLLSPLATGLFQGAICESGAPTSASMLTGEERSSQAIRSLLIRDGKARDDAHARLVAAAMDPTDMRAYLRSRSDREIIACYQTNVAGILDNPSPLLDGYVLPAEGYRRYIAGTYPNKVPLIIGSNKEETKLFLAEAAAPVENELYGAVSRWGSEMWQAVGVDAIARELSSSPGQPPVYAYRFDWGAPDAQGRSVEPGDWGRRLGAFHGLEIPFLLGQDSSVDIFNALLFTKSNEAGRLALSSAMMSYAAQFARTGNPNAPDSGLLAWQPWSNTPGAPKFIVFDASNDSPSLSMSDAELTRAGVTASMDSGLPEPLRGQVKELISLRILEGQ